MGEFWIHYGVVKLDPAKPGKPWKLVAECGNIIREGMNARTGNITTDLRQVTCPDCQEANALKALVEFT